jgi:hypothetical protein
VSRIAGCKKNQNLIFAQRRKDAKKGLKKKKQTGVKSFTSNIGLLLFASLAALRETPWQFQIVRLG